MTHNKSGLKFEVHTIGGGFTLEKAVKLMHHEVIRKSDKDKPQSIEIIGVISGILTINDQMEIVVQFYGGVEQFTEAEFDSNLIVTSNDK
jgi:hypothetical protein